MPYSRYARVRLACLLSFSLCVATWTHAQGATSAAVRIVRYGADARPPSTWTRDPRPMLEIGGATGVGSAELSGIMGVARLRDGRFAVANRSSNEIRLFTPQGQFQRALGRSGQGPGEFDPILWSIQASADTIVATDNNGRAQVFGPDGAVLRSLGRPATSVGFQPMRGGLLADGSAIVSVTAYPPDTTGDAFLLSRIVLRESGANPTYARALQLPAYERRRNSSGAPVPIMYRPEGAVVGRGDRICGGYSAQYEVTCHDAHGRPLFTIQRATVARPITDEERQLLRDAYVAANTRRGASPDVVQHLREQTQQYQFAPRAPSFGQLLLSDDGELWVSEFDPSDRVIGTLPFRTSRVAVRWSVYGPTGAWLADILLPARFTPYDVGRDFVAGVSLDSDDVERVTVWRIRR